MSSGLYESGINAIMAGNIDLENYYISAILIDTSLYTVNLANDSNQDDIPDSAQIQEALLNGKTLDGSVFRASDLTFKSVPSGQDVGAIVLFLNTDYSDTSILIAYLDFSIFSIYYLKSCRHAGLVYKCKCNMFDMPCNCKYNKRNNPP